MRRAAPTKVAPLLNCVRGCLLCAAFICSVVAGHEHSVAAQQAQQATRFINAAVRPATLSRSSYDIQLTIDLDGRAFTGVERVRWVNHTKDSSNLLYFHLYANVRGDDERQPTRRRNDQETPDEHKTTSSAATTLSPAPDEPRLDIRAVRAATTNESLAYVLDERETILRVNLREGVAVGEAFEVLIEFAGRVPEISAEETGLLAHVMQQVDAAIGGKRERRRARDINFAARGVMLLGAAYPVLAAGNNKAQRRKIEAGAGDAIFAEVADYNVSITTPAMTIETTAAAASATTTAPEAVQLFASGEATGDALLGKIRRRTFTGKKLREFAIIIGRRLRAEERRIGETTVRSVFLAEHEAAGRRVLNAASEAVRVFAARFGPLPYKTMSVVEAPLAAGVGSAEFSCFSLIAGAFYVDFDAPTLRDLPQIIVEHRASIEDSLEWTVANVVAHQWWGELVGNDPEQEPLLDEALANWSALYYYEQTHGKERAAAALDDQLRGVYKVYRAFGGEDMAAARAAREYRNFFQYAAIVSCKGALMFAALRRALGDTKFFAALDSYLQTNKFEVAAMSDLREAFRQTSTPTEKRISARIFNRWLNEKHGDEDIAPPNASLAAAIGKDRNRAKPNERGNAFARLGKFFWQQMTRVR